MEIEKFTVGMVNSNAYIVNDENHSGIVIDCGGDADKLLSYIEEKGLDIKAIILTHYHFDHIMGVKQLKDELGAEVLVHRADKEGLEDAEINLSAMHGCSFSIKADRLLADDQRLEIADLELEIIHTPGHTPGGICIKIKNFLFTGDTIFKGSIGRTDLPNGNRNDLSESIKDEILTLEEELTILPGHMQKSSLEYEKENNRFLKQIIKSNSLM